MSRAKPKPWRFGRGFCPAADICGAPAVATATTDLLGAMQHHNFRRENLTPARIQGILAEERKAGRMPVLKTVEVWVSGRAATFLPSTKKAAASTMPRASVV
ncbi:MAG: hypothetical protein M3Z32_12410 [Acidobacteriota bacterium]|nr:hypothetical protein [Acidobacteriota bacterium]